MLENALSDIPITLISKDLLLLSSFDSLLKVNGCKIDLIGSDLAGLDPKHATNYEDNIILIIDTYNHNHSILTDMDHIINTNRHAKIIVISRYESGIFLEQCFQRGALGYVLMSSSAEVLTDCMRLVWLGQNVFPSKFVKWFAKSDCGGSEGSGRSADPISVSNLRKSEYEILQMLICGLSNKEIGLNFNIPDTSVKVLLKRLSIKIDAANRVQAAVWAVTNGLTAFDISKTSPELRCGTSPNFTSR